MPETLVRMAAVLPTLVLSNATLFGPERVERLRPLADANVAVQISLDGAEPAPNDELRAPGNHARVTEAIPAWWAWAFGCGSPPTLDPDADVDDEDRSRLCALHRDLGVSDDDYVVRPWCGGGAPRLPTWACGPPSPTCPPS